MSPRPSLRQKQLALSLLIALVSLYVVDLGAAWVVVELALINVPLVMLQRQDRDAHGRAIPATRRAPGVLGSGVPYSQTGGKFGMFFSVVAGNLLTLMQVERWWPRIGIETLAQKIVVLLSLCISVGYLLVYIYQRWPDEPRGGAGV